MRKILLSSLSAVALAAAAVSAQTPSAPGSTQPSPPATGKPITVTGCLKSGSSTTGSTTATGNTSAAQFMLTNVDAEAGAAAAKPGAPGTPEAGRSGTMPASKSYALRTPGGSPNLAAHIDHKVSVTGTVSTDSDMSDKTPGRPGAPETEGRPGSVPSPGTTARPGSDPERMPTLTVTTVRMVATTCP